MVCLEIAGAVPVDSLFDPLRMRLIEGHLKQLGATRLRDVPDTELHIQPAHRRTGLTIQPADATHIR